MKNVMIFLLMIVGILGGCQDITVGYLLTEDANFDPDSLVIKRYEALDIDPGEPNPDYDWYIEMGWDPNGGDGDPIPPRLNPGEDYYRFISNAPWISAPVQGIEGTLPIFCSLKTIKPAGENAEKLRKYLKVYGDGTFEISLKHDIPVGRYLISLNFSNEGSSKDLDDCFTIIVK